MQLIQDILTQLATVLEIGMMLWFVVAFPLFVMSHPRHKATVLSSAPACTSRLTTTAIGVSSKSDSQKAAKSAPAARTLTIAVLPDSALNTVTSTTLPKVYRLRGEDVVCVDALSFRLPSGFKTYQLRGENVVRVGDLQGAKLVAIRQST